jgi:hypothetical protein
MPKQVTPPSPSSSLNHLALIKESPIQICGSVDFTFARGVGPSGNAGHCSQQMIICILTHSLVPSCFAGSACRGPPWGKG